MALLLFIQVESALAASSWNPTLLVNTESFQTIDSGDGATNIELRFGETLNRKLIFDVTASRFVFTQPVWIMGNLTATGALSVKGVMSGTTLRVDKNADIWGNLSASGTTNFKGAATFGSTIKLNAITYTFPSTQGSANDVLTTNGSNPGTLSWTSPGALSQGTNDARYVKKQGDTMTGALKIANGAGLTASGSILTDTNLTINRLNKNQDAVLTFGNSVTAQNLTYSAARSRFEFSGPVRVNGNMSGTTLNVDQNATIGGSMRASGDVTASGSINIESNLAVGGTIKLNGVTYTFPSVLGATGTILRTDASGNLTWSKSTGAGSGNILSLNPQYSDAVYFSSGSTTIGQLTYNYDTVNKQNYYRWTSSRTALNDYWISVRVKVPKTFLRWNASPAPITFTYRTGDASNTKNYASVRLLDTAGVNVPLTSGELLANTSWTTANITGVPGAGTYTPGGFMTVLIKASAGVVSGTTGTTDIGSMTFNWTSTAP